MPTYAIKCIGCSRKINVFSSIRNLTKNQLDELVESGYTEITEDQARKSRIELTEEDEMMLAEEGSIGYTEDLESICSPCGSDQDYDDEGNNITAV
ncbi:hypothetical protein [Cellvibrio sp. PSBB023]|uniref:hypothetical protein n=1 Tax=Cellvibrio sp. PSBB023 TaxID=1945512 RepID=UPI00098F3839|nr:hypothetical protein [Cellvibrio sp. PSBB023]AQT61452.1 hypothetical protein B0D95_16055 [Cellvibrio sp. PSBB023]